MGGDKGEGENKSYITPTLTLPHQWGGNYRRHCSKTTGNIEFKTKEHFTLIR
jgi:hypothetical protein